MAARTHLFGGCSRGWHFAQPLEVVVERDHDGSCLVSDEVFAVYGKGRTWDEAAADYCSSLVEFLQIMSESDQPGSRRVVDHLRAYLETEPATP
jgi:hypothetical protein